MYYVSSKHPDVMSSVCFVWSRNFSDEANAKNAFNSAQRVIITAEGTDNQLSASTFPRIWENDVRINDASGEKRALVVTFYTESDTVTKRCYRSWKFSRPPAEHWKLCSIWRNPIDILARGQKLITMWPPSANEPNAKFRLFVNCSSTLIRCYEQSTVVIPKLINISFDYRSGPVRSWAVAIPEYTPAAFTVLDTGTFVTPQFSDYLDVKSPVFPTPLRPGFSRVDTKKHARLNVCLDLCPLANIPCARTQNRVCTRLATVCPMAQWFHAQRYTCIYRSRDTDIQNHWLFAMSIPHSVSCILVHTNPRASHTIAWNCTLEMWLTHITMSRTTEVEDLNMTHILGDIRLYFFCSWHLLRFPIIKVYRECVYQWPGIEINHANLRPSKTVLKRSNETAISSGCSSTQWKTCLVKILVPFHNNSGCFYDLPISFIYAFPLPLKINREN